MKIGKVSQTVLKRSILKTMRTRREEVLFSPSVEEMCTAVQIKETECAVVTTATVNGNAKCIGAFAVARAVNDLATRGAQPIGVSVQITLPPFAYESRLKAMMEYMEELCGQLQIQITCAKAEVSVAVSQALVYVTAVGQTEGGRLWQSCHAKPEQDIVLIGDIGLEGMLRVAKERTQELEERFIPAFMRQIMAGERDLIKVAEIKTALEYEVSAIQQIGEGGILAALWDIAEASKVGLEVKLGAMSIRQETVEVCEHCHLNPYQLTSAGSILVVTPCGEELVKRLTEDGARAARLGRTTAENERVISGGAEKRFLDRPQPDELMLWWEREMNTCPDCERKE
ncbi:AIR synthase-related protein [Hespellia stercorisuis]|uniref:Hydrogenase maturation factor n=1 Tax=Hespellia stercorisuis DSM 15480 TaxID=1121950 RepID=A0A1M6J2F6_9FIRM|nr:AIR synthase-related protein [Hespellia stercorisuis]SHJ40781.1 Hydrogenase maturation factor [Hespellia stercorisuis DSM 15480]